MKDTLWSRLRWPIRTKDPYVAIPLGRGLFGTAAGTYNERAAVAIIPAPNFQPGEIGTTMEVERDPDGHMTRIPGGTIVISFETRRALDNFIDTCIGARQHFPDTQING